MIALPLAQASFSVNLGQIPEIYALDSMDYSGMDYCLSRNALMLFGGGGHAAGWQDYVVTYALDSQVWGEDYPTTPLAEMIVANATASKFWHTGRPLSRHTYSGFKYSAAIRKMLLLVSVNGEPKEQAEVGELYQGGADAIGHYDPVAHTWINTGVQVLVGMPACGEDRHPTLGGNFLIIHEYGWRVYDPRAGRYVNQGSWVLAIGNSRNVVYFPPTDRWYYFVEYEGTTYTSEIELNRTTWTPRFTSGLADNQYHVIPMVTVNNPPSVQMECAYVYDDANRLIVGGLTGGVMCAFDPIRKEWSMRALAGTWNHTYFCHAYVASQNVHYFASGEYLFALRWGGAGVVVPTGPLVPPVLSPDPLSMLAVGTLIHDGPPTPEQLSLLLPVTGALPYTVIATVRYRVTGGAWVTGHPLHRLRPDLATDPPDPATNPIAEAFAWPVTGLVPGTTYEVEVTVADGATSEVKSLTCTTRALPAAAGAPNKTIPAGTAAGTVQEVLHALVPGDVLQFEDGTYTLEGLHGQEAGVIVHVSGTPEQPIYIRGTSRNGTVLYAPYGMVLWLWHTAHVIIENMTIKASGAWATAGIAFAGHVDFVHTNVTVRNVNMVDTNQAVKAWKSVTGCLVYNNTFVGRHAWVTAIIDTDAAWNSDGINLPGRGNCAFDNTLSGFGDTFAVSATNGDFSAGVHYYRNDVRNSCDDCFEMDYGFRNMSIYDNRVHNCMTFLSLDPIYGGPLLVARNIAIGIGRSPQKWNSGNTGQYLYNNTFIRTTGRHLIYDNDPDSEAGWLQHNNGPQRAYGYRNNILIYHGQGAHTLRLSSTGHDPVDFTHNSWFPDKIFQWPDGQSANLAQAYANIAATTPVFSGSTQRHEQDNIIEAQPFTELVVVGENYRTEVIGTFVPALKRGTGGSNTGVVIAGVTDEFSGSVPDRGAIIAGRPAVQYGDRSGGPPPPAPPEVPPVVLSVSPTSISAGGTLSVNWSGIAAPTMTDWIGLYVPGAAATTFIEWIYVSCSQTPGSQRAAGSCAFVLPNTFAPGTYELRLLANKGFATTLATSAAFTVTGALMPIPPVVPLIVPDVITTLYRVTNGAKLAWFLSPAEAKTQLGVVHEMSLPTDKGKPLVVVRKL